MNSTRSLMKISSLLRSFPPLHQPFSSVAVAAVQSQPQVQTHAVGMSIMEQLPMFIQRMEQPQPSVGNLSQKQPKIICHRGRCDIYPENTLESICQGLISSDLVEFDVMLTKDDEVIVFHDRFLGEITNISQLQEFSQRKTLNDLNQFGEQLHSQWWTKEFTLQEIKKLSVKQKHPSRPQINSHFNIPTLQQVILKCIQLKDRNPNNHAGILIEVKTQRENFTTGDRDRILLEKVSAILKKYNLNTEQTCKEQNLPVIVQSFNHEAIQLFHSLTPYLPLAHLYYDEDQNVSQEYISQHRTPSSIGVAISTKHLTPKFIQMCHKMSYEIFYWSVRDDHPEIPLGCSSYQEFYMMLKGIGLDGIITDFAANCTQAIGRLLHVQ